MANQSQLAIDRQIGERERRVGQPVEEFLPMRSRNVSVPSAGLDQERERHRKLLVRPAGHGLEVIDYRQRVGELLEDSAHRRPPPAGSGRRNPRIARDSSTARRREAAG